MGVYLPPGRYGKIEISPVNGINFVDAFFVAKTGLARDNVANREFMGATS
jgi:hypothetical protein